MAESFVVRDRELESVQQRSIEKLAQHRWHWTLDDSNPDRVSIAEYARRVSRGRATIHRMAYGYKAWSVRNSGHLHEDEFDPGEGYEPDDPKRDRGESLAEWADQMRKSERENR